MSDFRLDVKSIYYYWWGRSSIFYSLMEIVITCRYLKRRILYDLLHNGGHYYCSFNLSFFLQDVIYKFKSVSSYILFSFLWFCFEISIKISVRYFSGALIDFGIISIPNQESVSLDIRIDIRYLLWIPTKISFIFS